MFCKSSGDKYQGQFAAGELQGFAHWVCGTSGDIYEGDWEHGCKHGQGVYTNRRDGSVYEGQWIDGVKNGEGRATSSDGQRIYEGQWRAGQMNGEGVLRCQDYTYDGSWLDGRRHGSGSCDFANGDSYQGQWKGDTFHGRGHFKSTCITGTEAATSSRPRRRSSGMMAESDTDRSDAALTEEYDGEWLSGQREGQGEWKDGKGNRFKGTFVAGLLHGMGEVLLPSKDSYRGQWRQGRKHGKGVFHFWDGSRIEGEWIDDQLHGTGVHVSRMGERTNRTYGHLTDTISPKPARQTALEHPDDVGYDGGENHMSGFASISRQLEECRPSPASPDDRPLPARRCVSGSPGTKLSAQDDRPLHRAHTPEKLRHTGDSSALQTQRQEDRPLPTAGHDLRSRRDSSQRARPAATSSTAPGAGYPAQVRRQPRRSSQGSSAGDSEQAAARAVRADDLDAFMRRVELQEAEEQERRTAVELARGLAADNWKLRQELAEANRKLSELNELRPLNAT